MRYFLPERGESIEDALDLPGKYQPTAPSMANVFAEDAALHCYSGRDLFNDGDWPLVVAVVYDGNLIGTYRVHLSRDPSFNAERIA